MKERIPISDALVATVEARLEERIAAGPLPRKAWTRQALIEKVSAKVLTMRRKGFSLDEIADAMSVDDLLFTPEMVSSYMSRHKRGASGNGAGKAPQRQAHRNRDRDARRERPETEGAQSPVGTETRHADRQRDDVEVVATPASPLNLPDRVQTVEIADSRIREPRGTTPSSIQPENQSGRPKGNGWLKNHKRLAPAG